MNEVVKERVRSMRELLRLRGRSKHPVNVAMHDEATFGEKLADGIAAGIGSWRFLIIQTVLVVLWFALNIIGLVQHWDPYPFILLNLLFSIQAAYTGPVLLLAGNRAAQRDRLMAEHDYATNEKAEALVEKILDELLNNTRATLAIAEKVGAELEAHIRKEAEAHAEAPAAEPAG